MGKSKLGRMIRIKKFHDYEYKRPDLKEIELQFNKLLKEFDEAASFEEQDELLLAINRYRAELDTQFQIAMIRHSIDTRDEFYKAEQDYLDETDPMIQQFTSVYYQSLVNARFRNQLEEKWGKQLFALAEQTLKVFSPEVIEELQLENKLSTEYAQLLASAQIPFQGEDRTLSQLIPFEESQDRSIRKQATAARFQFMAEHEEELDRIFDELVKVRTSIAKKLGYDSFVQLSYDRMNRLGYDAAMVANFRKQVEEHIVPITVKLKQRQQNRIGVDRLMIYDNDYAFKSGNAVPKGNPEWIIEQGRKMYREMSPETNSFFEMMLNNELMDLLSKDGKQGGGYCTSLPDYKVPFIFSNFNGTSGDIDVLTHELGHAFQYYQSKDHPILEYNWGTFETSEIHSMSMEFIAWPWMELFFEDEADKYRFTHMERSLIVLPYIVAVDEFQHLVYESPEVTPEERKQMWLEMEKKYLPYVDYEDFDYLRRGGFWQKQRHIYQSPFYYIDYGLALICALQFWKKMNENGERAWDQYLQLCRAGGTKSFVDLVEDAGLVSPFKDGSVVSVVKDIESWLDSIDDSKL